MQSRQPLQAPPGIDGIHLVERFIVEHPRVLGQPGCASTSVELRLEFRVQLQEMVDVVRGVRELLGRQWAARPVGAGLGLVDGVAKLARHEFCVADLWGQAEQRRGDLGIEHRPRYPAACHEQDLEVLPGRVQDLRPGPVREERMQRAELEADAGVDEEAIGVGCNLYQAELRVVGAFAHELRVERDTGRALHAEHRRIELVLGRH